MWPLRWLLCKRKSSTSSQSNKSGASESSAPAPGKFLEIFATSVGGATVAAWFIFGASFGNICSCCCWLCCCCCCCLLLAAAVKGEALHLMRSDLERLAKVLNKTHQDQWRLMGLHDPSRSPRRKSPKKHRNRNEHGKPRWRYHPAPRSSLSLSLLLKASEG